MGDGQGSSSRKHFKGRMAAKGVFSLVLAFAYVALATSQSYDYTTKYPPTKSPPTHPTHPPTKYPQTYPTQPPTHPTYPPTKYPPTHPTHPPTHPTYPPTKYPPTKYPPTTPHHGGYKKSLCECINPWTAAPNAYRGDPKTLCGPQGPSVCYVDCNADCRDIKPTASAPRCKSSLACDIEKGSEWQ